MLDKKIIGSLLVLWVTVAPAQAAYHYCGPSATWLRAHHRSYHYRHFWVNDHCVPREPKAVGPPQRIAPDLPAAPGPRG